MSKFYLTTTLPYVNAEPHIGFALEIIQADVIARFQKSLGNDIIFNTGTDEHGEKIYKKALDENKDPQKYTDEYAAKFEHLKKALNLSYTNFIRTTDPHHLKAAQEFWERCKKNRDIYKASYKIKYCIGCELEKTESEIEEGHCIIHPNLKLETREEENYFFKFSRYQKPLLEFYANNKNFVVPDFRFNEIKEFVKNGVNDFSVSRIKEKMPWGISVPGDEKHVMYVWFDALINYISTLGWPENKARFEEFWGTKEHLNALQLAGKDNLRQQSAMWQSMLMSAGLPNSKQILIHGFITSDGQKMSKSLGNVVNPFSLAEKYGTDALRYFLTAKISPFEDSDFTIKRFEEVYNSDLANGLGNLVSRVAKLCENGNFKQSSPANHKHSFTYGEDYKKALGEYRFNDALSLTWDKLTRLDKYINEEKPWELLKEPRSKNKDLNAILSHCVDQIQEIAVLLEPFMPETSEKIKKQFEGKQIKSEAPLFPRI